MDQYDRDIDQAIRLVSKKSGYQHILENNLSSHGAKAIKAKREKKKVDKKTFSKNGVKTLLIVTILLSAINLGITLEDLRYDKSVDYVNSEIVTESVMNIDGNDIKGKIASFINEMKSKGLSENSVMFYIKDLYGNDMFDLAAQTLGYKDGGEYIISVGYKDEVLSSSGETVYASYPEEIKYEIESKHEFVDDVNEIKESRKGK